MASLWSPFSFLVRFLSLVLIVPLPRTSASSKPLCHDNEKYALLQFKQSFSIRKNASNDPFAYPKVLYWDLPGQNSTSDCCLWDGVECDQDTGNVIGLDLSSSCLYGSISFSSTLFQLVHLQKLNLAHNDFNFSQIPSQFSVFSSLTYLNLSSSVFYGQIPSEIAELANLTSLDLGTNTDESLSEKWLELKSSDLIVLAQNLTRLQRLDLSYVNISSTLPNVWRNLSSLTFLNLEGCNIWGLVPPSLGELTKLVYLNLGDNSFSGQIPPLFANFAELNELHLFKNRFTVGDWSWLSKLKKLTSLMLNVNNLSGQLPSVLANLTQLSHLDVSSNELTGQMPSWLSNLTQLTILDLGINNFSGGIPKSISNLVNLEHLDLGSNYFAGTIDFHMFMGLKNLTFLHLSGNMLSLVINIAINATIPKFTHLGLSDCDFRQFPDFLKQQDELNFLALSRNNIQGQIPKWLAKTCGRTLSFLFLSGNFLTGFEQSSFISLFTNLRSLHLDNNQLQGSLPIPPPSIVSYNVHNNHLVGEIPPLFCELRSLTTLDLSNNNLTGKIPQCLSNSVAALILADNFFSGSIPGNFSYGCRLRMLDLGRNQLGGRLPRSLANCTLLNCFDISRNSIVDTFPFWLGSLPHLQIINFRSNQLFGGLESSVYGFSQLQIIDLAHNNFAGTLPFGFFQALSNMKAYDQGELTYMQSNQTVLRQDSDVPDIFYGCQIYLAIKGFYRFYSKIPNVIMAIDLAGNKFQGMIPSSIGNLKMVNVINLSGNNLSGTIPSSFGGLANTESLDLSQNMLSGEIPPGLAELTFLSYFNVSHNQLEGPIPQAQQFGTFDNTSYAGNAELCGLPLSRGCGNSNSFSPPESIIEEDGGSGFDIFWMVVVIGYGGGIVLGAIIGNWFANYKHQWLVKTFGVWQRQKSKGRKKHTSYRN